MQNKWKEVVGYEKYYEISSDGYVRTKQRKVKSRNGYRTIKSKILKPLVNHDGYYQVTLCKNNIKKTKRIHRLVAEAFLENPYNFPVINHKDENKLNNNVSNLEWCTVKYNTNYGDGIEKRASKRRVPIIAINNNITLYFSSIREAEIKLNLNHANIISCLQNKRKSCGGYIFKYNRTGGKTERSVEGMKVKLKQLETGDNYNVYCNETMASHSGEETEVIEIFAINEYANGEKTKIDGLLGYHLAADNGTYIYTADMFGG